MIRYIDVYRASLQGHRDANEDVEKVIVNMYYGDGVNENYRADKTPADIFIICDGHGGSSVAEYVASELEKYLTNVRIRYPLNVDYVKKLYTSIQKKIVNHPERIGQLTGSTALVVIRYVYQNSLWIQVINLGDCRAVISKSGIAVPLTQDHKPHWPDEKRRIDKVNENRLPRDREKVKFNEGDWRIKDLSVSRSFGDLDNYPYVTHVPEVYNYLLTNQDKFIVIACDGVWDVLENHEVINFVSDHLMGNHIELYDIPLLYDHRQHPPNMSIAKKLAKYTIARGSRDNVSVIIIDLYASQSKKNENVFKHFE